VQQFEEDRGWRVLYDDGEEEWVEDRGEMRVVSCIVTRVPCIL
jgi:hypothetical protein